VANSLMEQAFLVEGQLPALSGRKFGRQSAREVVELHGRITRKLSERTGNVWLTSFVSKYLHFHCPIVPLYDSNVAGRIGNFVDWQTVTSVRDSLATSPDWARAYRNFVAAFIALYEQAWAETALQPSVREIDYLLWQPGQ
jgi:hypothetical protein